MQHFIGKNKGKLSVGITLDGTKKKHDLQRVFPDGTGSYDAIHNNIEVNFMEVPKLHFQAKILSI